jgi:glycosyltransferase involved in cell wall biosynthesis
MFNCDTAGYVKNELLPLLYNAADITIVPSYSEGGPLTTPESLACGTPVIATNVGGNPEYLKLAHLDALLVELSDYNFSATLANKILVALQEEQRVDLDSIPSWSDEARIYINNILSELSSSSAY